MSFEHGAISNQVCDSCSYSLQGLPVGSKCPECGHSSTHKSTSIQQASMSFQAPTWYIKWVRYGFLLCMLSIIGGLSMPVVGIIVSSKSMLLPIASILFIVASLCWPAGVWMITRSRKGLGTISHDDTLDNTTLTTAIRSLSILWPIWIALMVGGLLTGYFQAAAGGAGGFPMLYSTVASIAGVLAWIGLIPACIYFAELSHWASDQWLANRLRATAWVMTVFGILSIGAKLLATTSLPISSPAKIIYIWTYFFSFIATVVLFYSMFRMSILLNWALSHQRISAQKHARLAARIEKEMGGQSGISNTTTTCEYCDYNLQGLPHSGTCPECGEHYGDSSLPFPIRDPAKDKPRHDDAPIHIEESTHGTLKYPRPLGIPLEDTTDHKNEDGDDIPLADDTG